MRYLSQDPPVKEDHQARKALLGRQPPTASEVIEVWSVHKAHLEPQGTRVRKDLSEIQAQSIPSTDLQVLLVHRVHQAKKGQWVRQDRMGSPDRKALEEGKAMMVMLDPQENQELRGRQEVKDLLDQREAVTTVRRRGRLPDTNLLPLSSCWVGSTGSGNICDVSW